MICRVCHEIVPNAREGSRCPNDGSLLVNPRSHEAYPRDLLLGQTVGEEFGVVSIVGRGGFGTVYRALQFPLLRPVALKVLHSQFYENELVRQRFFQEARAMAALRSPSVVTLIRYGEQAPGTPLAGSPGFLFIAQEFIEGRTLRDVLDAEAPLSTTRALTLSMQILRGLAEAHRAGIVHRDLKPPNIMVVVEELGDESAKVLDFGIAKMLGDDEFHDGSPTTRSGMAMGTPDYMAPEQTDSKLVDPRADIYSLGVILFEMLTGRKPFVADTHYMLITAHRIEPPPPLEGVKDAPLELEAVIHRALAKEPEDRFGSAREMAEALRELNLTGQFFRTDSMPALPMPPSNRAASVVGARAETLPAFSPPRSRMPWVVLAAIIVGITIAVLMQPEPPPPPPPAAAVAEIDAAPAPRPPDASLVTDAAPKLAPDAARDAAPAPEAKPRPPRVRRRPRIKRDKRDRRKPQTKRCSTDKDCVGDGVCNNQKCIYSAPL